MSGYLFGNYTHHQGDAAWSAVVRHAHETNLRPLCLCKPRSDAVGMYIARVGELYVLKRLPNSGSKHSARCEHYDPPPELSGLGQVQGSAIRQSPDDESTTLALDFALRKGRSRVMTGSGETEHESVRNDGTKLSLRALFHYLFDQAGLTRWSPKMAGKRNWYVVRRELLLAAHDKKAKGSFLSDLLYIPESFFSDEAEDIGRRQANSLLPLSGSSSERMIVIGEVKSLDQARFGYKLFLKHAPNLPLAVNDELFARINKVFGVQLGLWNQVDSSKLMALGTISLSAEGIYSVETLCLMNVNENWIPFDNLYEFQLLQKLHSSARRFSKGLRYNLSSSTALACVVLQDTEPSPTALFVVPNGIDDAYETVAEVMQEQDEMATWLWYSGRDSMPVLPDVSFPSSSYSESSVG